MVHYGRWPFRKNASEELLKSGLAHVYRQAGAVYGGRQEVFEQLEAKAKAEVINIWSLGEAFETSGEYKARMRSTY
jgi:micrococcal nuclease